MTRASFLLLLMLAACTSPPPAPPVEPTDGTQDRNLRAGNLAFAAEHPDEAVAQYEAALLRAQARDDISAIGDLGYDLAVAELAANAPGPALSVARRTRQDLERRGVTPFPALMLAEATALYRTAKLADADEMARRVQAGGDRETTTRATFLRGLIADEQNDEAGLAAASVALSGNDADANELAARLALRQGKPADALADAAANARREARDYRGMARALALEGEAARRKGDTPAAADYYFRAGRSAYAQHDAVWAQRWLKQASVLNPHQPIGDAADELLHKLAEAP